MQTDIQTGEIHYGWSKCKSDCLSSYKIKREKCIMKTMVYVSIPAAVIGSESVDSDSPNALIAVALMMYVVPPISPLIMIVSNLPLV